MQLQRYLDVSQASDLEGFRSRLVSCVQEFGFPLVTGALVEDSGTHQAPPKFHVVSNMPEAFASTSADPALSRRDPVNRRLRTLSVPFFYDQRLYVAEGAADLWDRQAQYGYKFGIAVALHLPGGRHFLLGADREKPLPKAEGKLIRLMADLQFLAVHAQSAATRLLAPPTEAPPRPSPRELEVLKWTHAGKNAWETSMILGVAEATVNFHISNVCKKFGVTSKHQAVLKAMTHGWIL